MSSLVALRRTSVKLLTLPSLTLRPRRFTVHITTHRSVQAIEASKCLRPFETHGNNITMVWSAVYGVQYAFYQARIGGAVHKRHKAWLQDNDKSLSSAAADQELR